MKKLLLILLPLVLIVGAVSFYFYRKSMDNDVFLYPLESTADEWANTATDTLEVEVEVKEEKSVFDDEFLSQYKQRYLHPEHFYTDNIRQCLIESGELENDYHMDEDEYAEMLELITSITDYDEGTDILEALKWDLERNYFYSIAEGSGTWVAFHPDSTAFFVNRPLSNRLRQLDDEDDIWSVTNMFHLMINYFSSHRYSINFYDLYVQNKSLTHYLVTKENYVENWEYYVDEFLQTYKDIEAHPEILSIIAESIFEVGNNLSNWDETRLPLEKYLLPLISDAMLERHKLEFEREEKVPSHDFILLRSAYSFWLRRHYEGNMESVHKTLLEIQSDYKNME